MNLSSPTLDGRPRHAETFRRNIYGEVIDPSNPFDLNMGTRSAQSPALLLRPLEPCQDLDRRSYFGGSTFTVAVGPTPAVRIHIGSFPDPS